MEQNYDIVELIHNIRVEEKIIRQIRAAWADAMVENYYK